MFNEEVAQVRDLCEAGPHMFRVLTKLFSGICAAFVPCASEIYGYKSIKLR